MIIFSSIKNLCHEIRKFELMFVNTCETGPKFPGVLVYGLHIAYFSVAQNNRGAGSCNVVIHLYSRVRNLFKNFPNSWACLIEKESSLSFCICYSTSLNIHFKISHQSFHLVARFAPNSASG